MLSLESDQWRNVFPTDDDRAVLDLEGLTFETVTNASVHCGFFCTQVPNGDRGQSSHDDNEPNNADMKKEFESFRLHVDSKFGEILQAIIGNLAKKVDEKSDLPDKKDDFAYYGGSYQFFYIDNKQDVGDVRVGDDTMKDVNVGVCGGESMNEVVGEQNDSHGDFPFVSMSELDIAAITQNYHTNKKVKNEKVPNLKLSNSGNLLDAEFFVNLSDSTIATITQAAKVGAASIKGEEHEQATKDIPLETITVSAASGWTSGRRGSYQGMPHICYDIVRPEASQVAEEVPTKETLQPGDDIVRAEAGQVIKEVPINATCGVKDSEVGPSEKSWG
ncbi:hypothetical protein K7X08_026192 [Anisodus acutangulus]|uniref:Uncharacterized protein n=1 Tax=Anisodus acutangulus TaxID=402998 RepID=A0A9Q1RUX0_9SOLA|nr:hypothetical protein K7X08_026192 [Anisodus acutangulus]